MVKRYVTQETIENCVHYLTAPTNSQRKVLQCSSGLGLRFDRLMMTDVRLKLESDRPDVKIIISDQNMISTEFGSVIIGELPKISSYEKIERAFEEGRISNKEMQSVNLGVAREIA